ncbi:succinylglutamate desuccinylase/aspartoacylase family protein [Fulvivirga lutea]|uniref:Succinylglutamate desuccinylase/aspartoacylase family protein n=1 Tax=Fulvivirga lutea TaxID=2810512 RepID=A0A975A181_9BACT|nr:succinylglutamate desuccinylase/aspartoacylase family protein [Fulvivirga lutea]QSE98016.1 succinylglutamate desuccinylase/aspartoacylase family protein [Fulvivirga lutea]
MIKSETIIDITNKRQIGRITGATPGPTLIFTAGIHGNEPSGVTALENVFNALKNYEGAIKGTVIGHKGNLRALNFNVRFIDEDLNRIWSKERLKQPFNPHSSEAREQVELWQEIQDILSDNNGPYYFFDLHTTSGQTIPFLTVNDSLLNRRFTKNYPLPIVLGIEEYLKGPILSYINELGYVAFGFEGGQHSDGSSIIRHEHFIYTTLGITGVLSPHAVQNHKNTLKELGKGRANYFEIFTYQHVPFSVDFEMKPSFKNFQKVKKGELLAILNGEKINSPTKAQIFMPLYQQQGDDGFFLVRPIPRFFLWLSKHIRKWYKLLTLLPGVHANSADSSEIIVNTHVARFFPKQIFHLFGYRARQLKGHQYIMQNRETASRTAAYYNEPWF